jgi:D-alanyl-D-alanine dipeptidase
MGTRMGEFVDNTHTHSEKISPEARANRLCLLTAMTESGFINFPGEWWHFSYGAREWAAYTGVSETIYGLVDKIRVIPEQPYAINCLLHTEPVSL